MTRSFVRCYLVMMVKYGSLPKMDLFTDLDETNECFYERNVSCHDV